MKKENLLILEKNDLNIFLIFLIFLFSIITAEGKTIENRDFKVEKKVLEIENNIKNNCYNDKYFYERGILKETKCFFKINDIKKIEELTTDAGKKIFIRNYYFLKNMVYVQYKNFLFKEDVNIHFLKEAKFVKAKKEILEFFMFNGEIIKMFHKGIEVNDIKKIKSREKLIINNFNEYIYLSKYLNKPNYREYEGERWGMRKRFPLCGKEKAIKLTYTFNKPFYIEIIDSNEETISEIEEMPKENKATTITRIIPLPRDKKFDLDSIQVSITSLTKGSKWKLRIEFEE
ncbi:MAG: hypothetical protein GY830_03100 [Bacteroidetes bacterium]|nr:hypothetical protein [Bacteroidota bacterium]